MLIVLGNTPNVNLIYLNVARERKFEFDFITADRRNSNNLLKFNKQEKGNTRYPYVSASKLKIFKP